MEAEHLRGTAIGTTTGTGASTTVTGVPIDAVG